MGMAALKETDPTLCPGPVGKPVKIPVWLPAGTSFPIVKSVAVLMFPVGDSSAVMLSRLTKAWLLVLVAACTPVAREREIAGADSSEMHIKLRLRLMIHLQRFTFLEYG